MHTDHLRGALLSNSIENKATNQSNQRYKTLQAYGKNHYSINHFFNHLYDCLKRAPLRWSVGVKASVSIEASIAIPVFLFAFLEILSLLNCLSVYSGMLYTIKSVTDPIGMYGYAYDMLVENEEVSIGERVITSLVFSEGYLESGIRKQCDTTLYEQVINGGIEAVSFLGSQINRENQCISVNAHYETVPAIRFAGAKIPMKNYYFIRMWTGYELEEDEAAEDTVYITATGNVYHTFRECSHLTLSIRTIPKSEIQSARNEYGGAYTNCPMCLEIVEKEERVDTFYITLTGNRYHGKLTCSALKRTIYCVSLEEVEGRDLCKRCEERGTK